MPSDTNLRERLTRLRNNLRVFGPAETARAVLLRYLNRSNDRFDTRFGVATDGDLAASDVTSPNRVYAAPYQPTHERVLAHLLRALPIDPAEYTFVDLGCGKGRALLMASELPFSRIVGIDFSPSLCRLARENLAQFREHHADRVRCERVEVVCNDVAQLEVPAGNVVFYLFNPFEPPVLKQALDRIGEAARRSPRELLIAYCHSKHGTRAFEDRGWRQLGEHRVISPWWSWSLWRWMSNAPTEPQAPSAPNPSAAVGRPVAPD